tara:strand:- start:933 stop:1202 length:270 start_codon:yes stop_codon:yes gene_type:complete
MNYKKINKSELIKMIKKLKIDNDDYKKRNIELQTENISFVVKMNNLINTENSDKHVSYLKKRIYQTQNNEKKDLYINQLNKYLEKIEEI